MIKCLVVVLSEDWPVLIPATSNCWTASSLNRGHNDDDKRDMVHVVATPTTSENSTQSGSFTHMETDNVS